ncbi:hypothetical protein PBI_MIMI_6 [Arthrobacter phage Mimi]|jgi:hypothetical protein|nr:hypothetical protein PBI_MIMI_85 [Arthrobacter phage Mimi]
MSTETFKVGDEVEVTAGQFAGAHGAVADFDPEFHSVMRIETKGGIAFAFPDAARKITKQQAVVAKPSTKPLQAKRR